MNQSPHPGRASRLLCCLMLGLLTACADPVMERSLDRLVTYQSGYNGRDVITEGTVRMFDEPLHYWIEDAQLNRVAIEPAALVADHVGERVRVQGRFMVNRDGGRLIRASEVTLAGD